MSNNLPNSRGFIVAALMLVCLSAGQPAPADTLTGVANLIGANSFYSQGYTGTRTILGVIDAGLTWPSHEALTGQVTQSLLWTGTGGGTATVEDHATMVGGTMAAANNATTGPGIAYGAKLWTGQIANSFGSGGSFGISGNSWLYPLMVFGKVGMQSNGTVGGSGATTVDVMNSSWTAGDNTGNLDINVVYDYLAEQGVTMVCAAGNSGQGAGTVGAPANSWNVIAVGATTGTVNGQVTSWSSGGPTGSFNLSGTRTKPDIVAPGLSITMPTTGGVSNYATESGTSFASPVVAACAGLLIDMGKATARSTDPRLVKAVLLNSADKLAGWSQSVGTYGATRINYTPLDNSQGSGQVDLANAFTQYSASTGSTGSAPGPVGLVGWSRNTVDSSTTTKNYVFDTAATGQLQLTATLIWFMDRTVHGFNAASGNPYNSTSFSNDRFEDLDLLLYNADSGGNPVGAALAASISGWNPGSPTDPTAPAALGLDSVEQIYYTLPADGKYVLEVVWKAQIFNFVSSSQSTDFAIAWAVVPEPGTVFLLLAGLPFGTMLVGVLRRRPC